MDMEKLFWQTFNAQDENKLDDIVKINPLLNNANNWFPYGGRDQTDRGNFGSFDTQQSNPIPALVEKITNSIDSLLLKKCRLDGIDPRSSEAPQDMATAVEKFFQIKNGDFSEISQKGRRSIAEDIQVIAEGDKQTPNLIFYDNGEGQHPDDFPQTFLSLYRCNKTDIPFVQGKYNMGSTGAVIFCGEHRYQLIGSKLYDKLNTTRKSNEFGFTLVRKHPLNEEEEKRLKSSWYEYFIIDGKIPRFPIKQLDLGLYDREFTTGSIIKLYSYQLPRGSRSYVVWDLWRDFNHYLYHPALPFLVYEKRWPNQKTPSKPVLGNKIRLALDDREKKEKTITVSLSDSFLGEVSIEVHVFKDGVDQKEFINNKAVVFTQNGQVHGFLPRSFISSELGFSLLRDHMLIQVNCTKVKTSVRQDLFKGSRDRLNEGIKTEALLDKIVETLRHNEELTLLNKKRKDRILRESTEDTNLLRETLSNLSIDKDLLKLFSNDDWFNLFDKRQKTDKEKNGNKDKEKDEKEKKPKFLPQRFPSIFKIDLKENKEGKRLKSIPLNGKGKIQFATDVEDEYLFRPKEKGELEIAVLGWGNNGRGGDGPVPPTKLEDIFSITKSGPTEGSIKITLQPRESSINVGDEIELNARLSSPSGDLESMFWVKIVDPQKGEDKTKEKDKEDHISPPAPIRVFEYAQNESDKIWGDFGWNGTDIVKIITDQSNTGKTIIEGIAVNMDSFSLKKFISKNKLETEEEIRTIKNKYFLSVYLHSLFLFSILERIRKDENSDVEIDPVDVVPLIFKPYSEFLLSVSMIDR
jgi:hypothetical protein